MPYVLTLFVLAPHSDLPISEQFYNQIKEANERLRKVVAAEETYDAMMENFVELESTVLTLGARHLTFEHGEMTDLAEHRNLISRRVGNFLSSARLYRATLPRHVRHILGKADPGVQAFIDSLNDLKTQPIAYRIVEALRNYAQHQHLPLNSVIFHQSRDMIEKQTVAFPSWLEPQIDAVAVSKDRGLIDVAADIAQLGEKVKVMPLLRQYIEHVGNNHHALRELIQAKQATWESSLASARELYIKQYPQASPLLLGAGLKADDGTVSDRQYVSEDWAKYRQYLRIKHRSTINFSMRYVKWSE